MNNTEVKRKRGEFEEPKKIAKKSKTIKSSFTTPKEIKCLNLAEKISASTSTIWEQIAFFQSIWEWKGSNQLSQIFSKIFNSDNAIKRILLSHFQQPVDDLCHNLIESVLVSDQKFFLDNFFKKIDDFPSCVQLLISNLKKNIVPYYYMLSSDLQDLLWQQADLSIKEKLRETVFKAWYRGNFTSAPFDKIFCLPWRTDFWPSLLLDQQTQQHQLQPQAKVIVRKFATFLRTRCFSPGPYLCLMNFIITSHLSLAEKISLMKALELPLIYGCSWKDFKEDSNLGALNEINARIDWNGCDFLNKNSFSLSDTFALCQGDLTDFLRLLPEPRVAHKNSELKWFTNSSSISKHLINLKKNIRKSEKKINNFNIHFDVYFKLEDFFRFDSTFEKVQNLKEKYIRDLKKVIKKIACFFPNPSPTLLREIAKNFPEEASAARAFRIQSIFEDHVVNSSVIFELLSLGPTSEEWKFIFQQKHNFFLLKKLKENNLNNFLMEFIWDNIFLSTQLSFLEKIAILEKLEMSKGITLSEGISEIEVLCSWIFASSKIWEGLCKILSNEKRPQAIEVFREIVKYLRKREKKESNSDNLSPFFRFAIAVDIALREKLPNELMEILLTPIGDKSSSNSELILQEALIAYAELKHLSSYYLDKNWIAFLDKLYAEQGFLVFKQLFFTNEIIATGLKEYIPFMLELCLTSEKFEQFYRFLPFLQLDELQGRIEAVISAILVHKDDVRQAQYLTHLVKTFQLSSSGKFLYQTNLFAFIKKILDNPKLNCLVKNIFLENIFTDDIMTEYTTGMKSDNIISFPINEVVITLMTQFLSSYSDKMPFFFRLWSKSNSNGPSVAHIFLTDLMARTGNKEAQRCMALAMVGVIGSLSPWFQQYNLPSGIERRIEWIEKYLEDVEEKNLFIFFLKNNYLAIDMAQMVDPEFVKFSEQIPGILGLTTIVKLTIALACPHEILGSINFVNSPILQLLNKEMLKLPIGSLSHHFSALAYHFFVLFNGDSLDKVEESKVCILKLKTSGLLPSVIYDYLLAYCEGQIDNFLKKVSLSRAERLLPHPLFIRNISYQSSIFNFYSVESNEEKILLLEENIERSLLLYHLTPKVQAYILFKFQITKLYRYFCNSLSSNNLEKCRLILNKINTTQDHFYRQLYLTRFACFQRQFPPPNDAMLLADIPCLKDSAIDRDYKLENPIFQLLFEPMEQLPNMTFEVLGQRARAIFWASEDGEKRAKLKIFLLSCYLTEEYLETLQHNEGRSLEDILFNHLATHLGHFLNPIYRQQDYLSAGVLLITEQDWLDCKIKLQHILKKILSLPSREGDELLLSLLKDASACITQQKDAINFCYSTNVLDLIGEIQAKSWIDFHIQQFKESCPSLIVRKILPAGFELNVHDKTYCSNVLSKSIGLKPLQDPHSPTFIVGDKKMLLDEFLFYFRPQAIVDVISSALEEAERSKNTAVLNRFISYIGELNLKIEEIFDEEEICEGRYRFTPEGGFLLFEAMGYISKAWQKHQIFLDTCF